MEIYKVKVNYKSGLSQEFWCEEFTYNNSSATWKPYIDKKLRVL